MNKILSSVPQVMNRVSELEQPWVTNDSYNDIHNQTIECNSQLLLNIK